MEGSVKSILADKSFQEELKQAIESGKSTDYAFNGEDEYPVEVFELETANAQVMEVLKRWLVNE